MKGTIAAPMFLLAISCAAQVRSGATTEQAFLETALKWPTYFGVSSGEYDEIWTRARTWAETYGGGKLTVHTDSEITSIRPPRNADGSRTLRVTSTETFGGYRISVEVIAHRKGDEAGARRDAHILAYHLASGKAVPDGLASH